MPQPPASTTLGGRVLSLLRGDKYMVNAYPPQWRSPTTSEAVAGEGVDADAVSAPGVEER